MVPVRSINQGYCDDMVGEHLPVVLTALFDVDDNDLVHPKRQLAEHVAFHEAAQLPIGPVGPQILQVHPARRRVVYVLSRGLALPTDNRYLGTHQTHCPEDAVVDQEPALLAKSCDILSLGDALGLGERGKEVLHGRGAQANEENDAKEYKVPIVLAEAIAARLWVVVCEIPILCSVRPGFGHRGMGKEQ
jgi:hypothetical protein